MDTSVSTDRAFRREQRRRKIIENSEHRLKIILNQDVPKAVKPNVESKQKSVECEPNVNADNTVPVNPPNSSDTRAEATDGDDTISDNRFSKIQKEHRNDCHQIHTLPKILTENKCCRKVKNDGQSISAPLQKSPTLLQHGLNYRKLTCVLLAVVHQLIIRNSFGLSMSQYFAVFMLVLQLQFAITEFGQMSDVDPSRQPPPSKLAALLTLYGFKNINRISIFNNIIVKSFEDCAIYLFVFFLSHWLMGVTILVEN